jgi:hypothetical protein
MRKSLGELIKRNIEIALGSKLSHYRVFTQERTEKLQPTGDYRVLIDLGQSITDYRLKQVAEALDKVAGKLAGKVSYNGYGIYSNVDDTEVDSVQLFAMFDEIPGEKYAGGSK